MSNFVINKLRGAKKEDTFLNSLHHEFENYPLKIETPLSSFFVISLQKRQVTVFRDLDEYKRYQICFYRAR